MAENPIKTPLPADLPEDWTGGQTVAPTGAEVGLSEQHGYNYPFHRFQAAPAPLSFGIRTHKPTCQKFSTNIFTPRSRGKPNRTAY